MANATPTMSIAYIASFFNPAKKTLDYGVVDAEHPTGHHGTDYANPPGTPIPDIFSGKVVDYSADPNNDTGLGYYITVQSDKGIATTYGHMMEVPNFRPGDTVNSGSILGYVGNTGFSFGNHTHIGITQNGEPVDPFGWIQIALAKITAGLSPDDVLQGAPITTPPQPPTGASIGYNANNDPNFHPNINSNSGITGAIIGAVNGIPSVGNGIAGAASGVIDAVTGVPKDLLKILKFVTDIHNWWGLAFLGSGVLLIGTGIYLYSEDVREAVSTARSGAAKGAEVAAIA